ncbi:type II toxin-antitoxin system RelE/ParE family toxin [Botrimarina sp.]|uniref:type II toxin-antitoxin system RelE/ParE family toxin n=1 Tax=Botrimarina sp. TaxID=2795802 RepID=UPI0032F07276
MRLVITDAAKRDLQAAHDWWADNRSAEQASGWYSAIKGKIDNLKLSHRRCSLAAENSLVDQELRQALFGVGRRVTHRIVFTIDDNRIVVLRVRHVAQRTLTRDDLQ